MIAILIDKKGFHKSMNITGPIPVIEMFEQFEHDNNFGKYDPEGPQFYNTSLTIKKLIFYKGNQISEGVYEYKER